MWDAYKKGIPPQQYRSMLDADYNMICFIDTQMGTKKLREGEMRTALAKMQAQFGNRL